MTRTLKRQPPAPAPDVLCLRCTRCGYIASASTAQAAHETMLEHQRYHMAVTSSRADVREPATKGTA
jgi:hypothetical protein